MTNWSLKDKKFDFQSPKVQKVRQICFVDNLMTN